MMTSLHITKLAAFALMLMLVSIGFVSADIAITKYDHNQYMDSPYDETFVCSCSTATDYHTVTNVGDFASMFSFTLESEMEWVSMQQKQAYLLPGESIRVAVDVFPPCGLEQDPIYRVYSSSQYGRYRVAETAVTATVCESLQFSLSQEEQEVLPCTETGFTAYIKNIAPYDEQYTLSADTDAVQFAQTSVSLAPGEVAEIPATAQYSCDVSGQQTIEFSAYAKNSDSTHSKQATFNIVEDYEYTLSELQVSTDMCAEVQTTKQVLLTNIAETPNTYTLSHRGPGFAQLSEDVVVVAPGQSKVIDLTMSPTEANTGSYTSTIRATNEYGDVDKTLTINHEIRDCYENIVTVSPAQPQACAGWTDTNVRVENRGETTETFTLIPEGELYSEVSQSKFSLRPGEHRDVVLNISVPDETQQRTVELTVRQTPGIDKLVEVPVQGFSNEACTQIDVSTQKFDVYSDQRVVPVIVSNTGIRASMYDLSLESSIAELEEQQVFLAPGEQSVLHVLIPNADEVAQGQYTGDLRMVSDRAEYRQDLHFTIEEKGLFTKAYERLAFGNAGTVDWCTLAVLVLLVLFGLLAIGVILMQAGKLPSWMMIPSRAHSMRVLLAVLAVVFALLALVSFVNTDVHAGYTEEFAGTNYSQLYHEFGADEIYDLDLSVYFSDPDGEGLTYTHSQPENLRIQIVDNVARIKAAGDFSGQTQVVFTAQDPQGATADSPIMTVRAVKPVPVTPWQWIFAYCGAVNYLLLALIALLLIAAIRDNPRGELVELADGTVVPKNAPQRVKDTAVAQQRNTQVQGDVVAGDKVTNINMSNRDDLYVASVNGKKFHPADSHFVERMPKEDRIIFRTKDEAIKAGYSPSQQVR
jgi:uncharacterized membrane protein